ncbi:unnamed protein product [Colias eurytheme]|nr:unnamed protein product [Colias eurytheme]
MPSLFYTILLFLPLSTSLPNKECNRIKIGDKWYSKEILWSHIGTPYHLHVHKHTNTLIFPFIVLETYSDVDFQLAYYDLDTKEYSVIAGIVDGCSVAVDQKNDEIYLGGSDGIYKFNMVTKIADFYKEKGVNIWGLFHRRNLFYISYPDQKLYMEIDDKFAKVREFENTEVDYFHISSNNDIIFANKSGLYNYNNDNKSIHAITEYITVKQITEDIDGNVYISCTTGLYMYKRDTKELVRVLEMKNLHGIAFDRDNKFILSDKKRIFKLIESNIGCIAEDAW